MFLNLLNTEEKHQFLNLAVIAAQINGSLDDEELELISGYQREMDIALESSVLGSDLNEGSVFHFFSESEKSHKKIVLFEIIGLLACDSSFDEDERRFVLRFSNAIGLSVDDVDIISQLSLRYFDIVTEIADCILVQ